LKHRDQWKTSGHEGGEWVEELRAAADPVASDGLSSSDMHVARHDVHDMRPVKWCGAGRKDHRMDPVDPFQGPLDVPCALRPGCSPSPFRTLYTGSASRTRNVRLGFVNLTL